MPRPAKSPSLDHVRYSKIIILQGNLTVVAYGLLLAGFPDKRPKNGHIANFLVSPL